MKVLPGMQSAFVDIGLERDAFLYVSDFLDVLEDESVDFKEERPDAVIPAKVAVLAAEVEDDAEDADEGARAVKPPAPHPAERRSESRAAPRAESRAAPRAESRAEPPAESRATPPAESRAEPPAESRATPPAESVAASRAESRAADAASERPAHGQRAEGDQQSEGGGRRRRRRRRRGQDEPAPGADDYEVSFSTDESSDVPSEDESALAALDAAYEIAEEVPASAAEVESGVDEVAAAITHVDPYATAPAEPEPLFEIIRDDDLPPRPRPDPVYEEIQAVEEDVAVEVEAEAAPKKGRSSRSRSRKVAEPEPEPEPVPEAAPKKGRSSRSKTAATKAVEEAPAKAASSRSRKRKGEAPAAEAPVLERIVDDEAPPTTSRRASRTASTPKIVEQSVTADPHADREFRVGELREHLEETNAFEQIGDEPAVDLSKDADTDIRDSASHAKMATRRGGRRRGGGRREGEGGDGSPGAERPSEGERSEPSGEPSREDWGGRGRSAAPAPRRPAAPPAPAPAAGNGRRRVEPLITDLLHEGQEIIVQIAKEPIAKKGARITSHIALPGPLPRLHADGRARRRLAQDRVRQRARCGCKQARPGHRASARVPSGGFIVRTAAIGTAEEDLRDDMRYLIAHVGRHQAREPSARRRPRLLHHDLDLVQRILRDQLSDDFTAIRVDNERSTRGSSTSSTASSRSSSAASSCTRATSRSSTPTACRPRSTRPSSRACG